MAEPAAPPHTVDARHRVVIVGGGFGGLETAKGLDGAKVDICLIDQRNHHIFQPLLYQVATASLATSEIAWPIRVSSATGATSPPSSVRSSAWTRRRSA